MVKIIYNELMSEVQKGPSRFRFGAYQKIKALWLFLHPVLVPKSVVDTFPLKGEKVFCFWKFLNAFSSSNAEWTWYEQKREEDLAGSYNISQLWFTDGLQSKLNRKAKPSWPYCAIPYRIYANIFCSDAEGSTNVRRLSWSEDRLFLGHHDF